MGARWWAMTLAAAWLAIAGQATGQGTEPDGQAAPTTQPDEPALPELPAIPRARPVVTGVGPAVTAEGVRANELSPPPAAPSAAAEGTPPLLPTAEELMRGLQRGEAGLAGPPGVPRADEVAEELEVHKRIHVIEATQPTAESAVVPVESVRPDARQKLLPEGFAVRDSVGYLVRDQGRWLFVFDSDNSGEGTDPPLILLPNSLLEAMINQAQSGQAKVKFRVTGEVTQFRQTNYLLLRKSLIEHNLDRF